MPRPPPRLSSAQQTHLASLSRAQATNEASQRKIDAMEREMDESFAKRIPELDKSAAVMARHYAWADRYGHWLARAALIPILVLAAALLFMVMAGLWNGEIKELSKYSKLNVVRAVSPVGYWLSVFYHAVLAAFIVWVANLVWRGAKIFRRNKI